MGPPAHHSNCPAQQAVVSVPCRQGTIRTTVQVEPLPLPVFSDARSLDCQCCWCFLSMGRGEDEWVHSDFPVLLSGAQPRHTAAIVTVQVEDDGRTVQVEASLLVLKLPPGVQIAGQPRASGAGLTGAVQSTEDAGAARPQSEAQSHPPGAVGQVAGEAAAPAGVHQSNLGMLPVQPGACKCASGGGQLGSRRVHSVQTRGSQIQTWAERRRSALHETVSLRSSTLPFPALLLKMCCVQALHRRSGPGSHKGCPAAIGQPCRPWQGAQRSPRGRLQRRGRLAVDPPANGIRCVSMRQSVTAG